MKNQPQANRLRPRSKTAHLSRITKPGSIFIGANSTSLKGWFGLKLKYLLREQP